MKNIIIGLVLVLCVVGVSFATESTSCYRPPTPDCICNCSDAVQLPGLWKVVIASRRTCGEITVIGGSSAIIEDQKRDKTFFLLNKVKFMEQVESCE